jgi:hypothetical protein
VAEDETESNEEEELPHAITYKAFVDFSRNDEQRATLSEELKSRGCGTLLDLLRLFLPPGLLQIPPCCSRG